MSKKPVAVVAAVFYEFLKPNVTTLVVHNVVGDQIGDFSKGLEIAQELTESCKPFIAIFRRLKSDSGGGYWEFPGGKVHQNETEEAALSREIQEELGIQIKVEDKIGSLEHQYDEKLIKLSLYLVRPKGDWKDLKLRLTDHDSAHWVSESDIPIDAVSYTHLTLPTIYSV